MDLRDINAFITVAEELNFRKAAEMLHMTQPPLTRLISQLESDLGVKLFTRTTRKVELTGAGLHLLQESRQLLESLQRVEREVRSIGKLKSGKLKIGLYGPVFHSELPRLISSFKDQFKDIELDMYEIKLSQQMASLKSGKLDVCFTEKKIADDDFHNQEIFQQELGFLISRSNPLSEKKSIKLSDLKGQTLIFHGKSDHLGFQAEFHTLLEKKEIDTKIYYKKSKESCPHLALMDKGLLMCSKNTAQRSDPGLKFVSLSDYSPKLKFYAVWNKNNTSLCLKAFVNFFTEKNYAPSSHLDCHLGNKNPTN